MKDEERWLRSFHPSLLILHPYCKVIALALSATSGEQRPVDLLDTLGVKTGRSLLQIIRAPEAELCVDSDSHAVDLERGSRQRGLDAEPPHGW
jgi:hypothetical protein